MEQSLAVDEHLADISLLAHVAVLVLVEQLDNVIDNIGHLFLIKCDGGRTVSTDSRYLFARCYNVLVVGVVTCHHYDTEAVVKIHGGVTVKVAVCVGCKLGHFIPGPLAGLLQGKQILKESIRAGIDLLVGMAVGMQTDGMARIHDFVQVFQMPRTNHKEGDLGIILFQNIQQLRCSGTGAVVKGQIDHLFRQRLGFFRSFRFFRFFHDQRPLCFGRIAAAVTDRVPDHILTGRRCVIFAADDYVFRNVAIGIVHRRKARLFKAFACGDGHDAFTQQRQHRRSFVVIDDGTLHSRGISGSIHNGVDHFAVFHGALHLVRQVTVHVICGAVAFFLIFLPRFCIAFRVGDQRNNGSSNIHDCDAPPRLRSAGEQFTGVNDLIFSQLLGVYLSCRFHRLCQFHAGKICLCTRLLISLPIRKLDLLFTLQGNRKISAKKERAGHCCQRKQQHDCQRQHQRPH